MIGKRLTHILMLVLATGMTTSAVVLGDVGQFKPFRIENSRLHQLIQIIQTDQDETKRKAAIVELGRADPRLTTEVIQTITEALLKDPSPAVRLTAIETIGRFNTVFPLTGLALESTVELDASPLVRKAAKEALWHYHLIGYKSSKSGKEFAMQTVEPPLAKPARAPVPVTSEPPVLPVVAQYQPPAILQLPPVGTSPGPRVALLPHPVGPVALLTAVPPHANLTVEPPIAPPSNMTVIPPPKVYEPPILHQWPELSTTGASHPYMLDLPPIVTSPGTIPGVTPFPDSTKEPPITKSNRK